MPETRSSAATEVRMSELMTPEDANFLGKVFGGSLLALLDKVAYVTASRFAGNVCVTASFDRVDFHSPIDVGELVHCVGRVVYVGKTSLQVRIEVYAEHLHTREQKHTNSCSVTMVAIDANGKPTRVPELDTESREDKINFLKGRLRRELRTKQRAEFDQLAEKIDGMSDQSLAEIIASNEPLS